MLESGMALPDATLDKLEICDNILGTIGHTPLVRLARYQQAIAVRRGVKSATGKITSGEVAMMEALQAEIAGDD